MEYGRDQQAALDLFEDFKASGDTCFALLGYAGTGKSMLTADILKSLTAGFSFQEYVCASPTHKAIGVLRRFMGENGLRFETGYDRFTHSAGTIITGTTAQLLGLQPVVVDDQTEDKRTFASVNKGMLQQIYGVAWIVIDEISMLARNGLRKICDQAEAIGARVLVIGDPGQLPPVSEKAIDFDALPWLARMEQVMRQPSDSAIPHLAAAVRHGENWKAIEGPGVDHFNNPAGAYLDEVGVPALDERQGSVYVAYTNARVNAVQEAACQRVYGHGRLDVEPGEIVISNNNLSERIMGPDGRQRSLTHCYNGERLTVAAVGERGEWGRHVTLRKANGDEFETEFVDEVAYSDPGSAFNVELRARSEKANDLQREWFKNRHDYALDSERKEAWLQFFELKDSTCVSLSHPFALTSHKSQGSSYRQAFVDATNLSRFDPRALYVASTRPSEELVIG